MSKQVADVDEYSRVELGARYRANAEPNIERPALTPAQIMALEQDGYVIIENVIPAHSCVAIRDCVRPLFEHESGRNNFEGFHTQRLYALFEKTLQCNPWIEHPLALSLVEQVLEPNPLQALHGHGRWQASAAVTRIDSFYDSLCGDNITRAGIATRKG